MTAHHRRPLRRRAAPWLAMVAALTALALLSGCAGSAPAPAEDSAPPQAPAPSVANAHATEAPPPSLDSLGRQVCDVQYPGCEEAWRAGMARGEQFNVLIVDACLWVYLRVSDDEGIACALRGIRYAPSLPDGLLVDGQFAPGERDRHPVWRGKSDRQWARSVARYFGQIPEYCDQATPIIFNYFPCLIREVRFFQSVLKQTRYF